MRRTLAFLGILLLSSQVSAQTKVRLEFPDKGERMVWTADGYGTQAPSVVDPVAAQSFEYTLGDGKRIFVWDLATGNLADRPVEGLKAWKVSTSDFKRVGVVELFVNHDGQPVASAHLTVKSNGAKPSSHLVSPISKGMVELWALQPGPIEIAVEYAGKDGKTAKSSVGFALALKRDQTRPRLPVTVLDEVETVSPKTGTAPSEKPAPARSGSGWIGTLITYLLAAGFAVGAIFLILHILKGKEGALQDRLKALGVQVPDPADPTDDATPVPMPAKPEPPPTILLDDAAPVPVAAASPAFDPYGAPGTGSPRLVGEGGRSFDIAEGLSAVGREAGLPISLEGESTVSRQHAEIVRSGDVVTVSDLGSTNGTFVNGVKVEAEVTLRVGDQIQFGAVRFRFE